MRNHLRAVALIVLWASQAQAQSEPSSTRASLGPPVPAEDAAPAASAAPLASLPPCPDESCADGPLGCGIPWRFTVRHDIGDGVGYQRGFTYLEAFVPLYQPGDCDLVFADLRVVNFDDWDRWEFNVGAGYRRRADGLDAVWGANLFYDVRHSDTNYFHQIGLGAEALFERWELRCNGYIIVGPHQRLVWETLGASVAGNQLVVDRWRGYEVAMGGVDAEAGAVLPVLPRLSPRAYVGFYHYSAENMPTANGIRGRLEAWLTDRCSLHFAIQNDTVFDTTVSGGLALHFGAGRRRPAPGRSVEDRLGQRVVRDVNIVLADRVELERSRYSIEPNESVVSVTQTIPELPQPPQEQGEPAPPCSMHYKCCLPFPGAPGNPATFPGKHYPPGFHHLCFPGLGRYKHLGLETYRFCGYVPRFHRWDD